MTLFTKPGREVFAPTDASGNPRQPILGEAVVLTSEYEGLLQIRGLASGGLVVQTKAELDSDLGHDNKVGAWVVSDTDPALRGIYRKVGAGGTGSWLRVGGLPEGTNGWSPVLAIEIDGARRVLEVVDWAGGDGTKPAVDVYIGATGFVTNVADAIDIRGPQGLSGDGSGDMVAAANLSDLTDFVAARSNLNVKELNADGGFSFATTATTQDFMPSGTIGGTQKAGTVYSSTDASTFAGSRSSVAFVREVDGSGLNGPGNSDKAFSAIVSKTDIHGTVEGEIDGAHIWCIQNAVDDAGALLLGGYKKVGDGTADEGGLTTIEATTRRFTTDLVTYDHWMNNIVGFSPSPASVWGGRAPIGFYSENHQGAAFANFLGITNGESGTSGTIEYLLVGFRQRNINTRYFSVDDQGNIESVWTDGGAAGGSWKRTKDSTSPAANDILWSDYWAGKNSAGGDIDYVRIYGAIADPADGSEDGQLIIRTKVNGADADQLKIQNGVAVGNATGGTQGTGSVNFATACYQNGTTRIDNQGGYRFPPFALTAISDAANAVNTSQKVAGKAIFDSTNGRVLVATGSVATAPWNLMDGTLAVTPA